jgi:hypothetical protein
MFWCLLQIFATISPCLTWTFSLRYIVLCLLSYVASE